MTSSSILIWNKEVDFIKIEEGTGDNLLDEDIEEGFVDYMIVDFLRYDGWEFEEINGTQAMMEEMYQDKFSTPEQVIEYLIEEGHIPDVEYLILFASKE